ncbi:DNA-directed RNA polymerase [Sphingobium bisphenolivorans]|uniref:DNA-directed RNA polymerase n=1 Tax=Sphingobium bisphenolivorans TaxID=1335760 RepID=UPI00039B03BF|nr:DNA-directed RNA polymerase [Sphingobium bisphenolivorans]
MSDIEVDLMEVQRDLEAESRAIGRASYRGKRNAPWVDVFGPGVDEASLPPGRAMLRRALKPTADAISVFLDAGKAGRAGRRHVAFELLAPYQPDARALAFLTLRCALQAGIQEHRVQKAAQMVARAIMDHIQATEFERVNPEGAAGIQRSLAGRKIVSAKRQRAIAAIHEAEGVALSWSPKQQVNLGLKLIELAAVATGLFELIMVQTTVGKAIRRERNLRVTEIASHWLERQHERSELLDPLPMPMVVSPRPWTTPTDGGYLQPPIGTRLVRSRSRPYREELANIDMTTVYRAVNAIQETRWRINRRVLDVVTQLDADGGSLAGLPSRDGESVPNRPAEADENPEVLARWGLESAKVHERNAAARSKRLTIAQQLWVARKLADFPAIYFPHELDFRGRVYPVPQGGPHPQAGDIGRALLEFAVGKPLGPSGARWLAIHVANVFGVDKVSFDERVAWVESNRSAILDSAYDPLDGHRFWTTAEKPWAALAACYEWAGYVEQGEAFVSHLPIAIDGSNSGLQHLTALLRDAEAAPHVNLTPADQPGDIYAVVAAKAQAMVDASNDPEATPWKNGRITRGIVKRPCMTYVYSATAFGMTDQVNAELQRLDQALQTKGEPPHLGGDDNFIAARWLAPRLYSLIGATVPAAKRAMDWLKAAAKVMNAVDLPLWWTTPAGLPVMQRYANTKAGKVEVTFRGKRLQLQLDEDASPPTFSAWTELGAVKVMDGPQSVNGIAPNFVHSLDAAHLMLTTVASHEAGIVDLAVIHDSFGTHASETDRLSRILRETFVAMYEGDPLAQFRAELLDQINDEKLRAKVPPLPSKGDLDLKSVLDAVYMFA